MKRAGGSGGYTMLACTRLGDDAVLTHLLRQQDLPEGIIDLVRPRVIEVLALEVDLRTILLAESARVVEGAGATHIGHAAACGLRLGSPCSR